MIREMIPKLKSKLKRKEEFERRERQHFEKRERSKFAKATIVSYVIKR